MDVGEAAARCGTAQTTALAIVGAVIANVGDDEAPSRPWSGEATRRAGQRAEILPARPGVPYDLGVKIPRRQAPRICVDERCGVVTTRELRPVARSSQSLRGRQLLVIR
jgi:hypothetical protein